MPGGPLRQRNFQLLLIATVVSMLGTSAVPVAMAFAMFELGHGAGGLGIVLASRGVTMFVFLLYGGVIADRFARHRVMAGSNLGSALAQAVFATLVLVKFDALWPFVVLAVVGGCAQSFFFPASEGLLPQTVHPQDLQRANALLQMGRSTAMIAGAAMSGFLVVLVGPGWTLAIDALTLTVAASLRAWMHLPPTERVAGTSVVQELREGWQELAARRWLRALIVQIAVVSACYVGAINVLGPLIAVEHFGGARDFGLMLASNTVGLLCGALLMLWLHPRRLLLVTACGSVLLAGQLAALAVPLPLPAVCMFALLSGLGMEVSGVGWLTLLQQEIREDRLSRVVAYDAFGSLALSPIAQASVAPASSAIGTSGVLLVTMSLILMITAAVLCLPEVRHMQRRDTAHAERPEAEYGGPDHDGPDHDGPDHGGLGQDGRDHGVRDHGGPEHTVLGGPAVERVDSVLPDGRQVGRHTAGSGQQ